MTVEKRLPRDMDLRERRDSGRRVTSGELGLGAACFAALVAAAACGVPVNVTRLSTQDAKSKPVEGLRYTVKRPSYGIYLHVVDEVAIEPPPSLNSCQAIVAESSKRSWHRDAPDGGPPCVGAENCNFQLVIEQKMEADPLVFEATSRVNPLADSEIEFTLKEDGALSAVTAGETDKTLDIVKAAVGLAKTAAAAAAAPNGPTLPYLGKGNEQCQEIHDKLLDYLQRRERAKRNLDCMKARAIQVEDAILRNGPTKDRLETLSALRTTIADSQKKLDDDRVKVPARFYSLTIDDVIVKQPEPGQSCRIDVNLKRVARGG